jgi:hypothetical protein
MVINTDYCIDHKLDLFHKKKTTPQLKPQMWLLLVTIIRQTNMLLLSEIETETTVARKLIY